MFKHLFDGFKVLWREFNKTAQYKTITVIQSGEESSSHLNKRDLLIVNGGEKPKWLRFKCPCGCGKEVALTLMSTHHPHWSISRNNGSLTVHPSVIVSDCGSHFWIKDSKVIWTD